MQDHDDALLRGIFCLLARQTFPVAELSKIVSGNGAGAKQIRAFNMCDGTKTQSEVAKALRLDSGNFSRTVARWVTSGVLIRLGDSREPKLLHVYPLPVTAAKTKRGASR